MIQRPQSLKGAGGFTLIELVVVITIIGILAAVALPRLVNLQRDARIAKLNAARGAVGGASALVHGAFLARNSVADVAACPGVVPANTADNTTEICSEGGVVMIALGYPISVTTANLNGAAANAGIMAAAGLTSVFNPTAAELATEGYTVTGTAAVQTIQMVGATAPATCQFTYTVPAVAGAAPTISAPLTAGC